MGIALLKEELSRKEQEISSKLAELNKYKDKNIVWVYGAEGEKDASLISALKEKGIRNVQETLLGDENIFSNIPCDVMVFSISSKENIGAHLGDLLSTLKLNGGPPLVVYTYNHGQQIHLSKPEWDILDKYDNHTLANFPGSLQATLNSILRWL